MSKKYAFIGYLRKRGRNKKWEEDTKKIARKQRKQKNKKRQGSGADDRKRKGDTIIEQRQG